MSDDALVQVYKYEAEHFPLIGHLGEIVYLTVVVQMYLRRL